MKRTPLQRKTPLRRKTRLRARGDTAYRRRPRDLEYMKWVKRLPCAVKSMDAGPDASACSGKVEADHAGRKPAGWRKAPDRTCIPMCQRHHQGRELYTGVFKDWSRDQMRTWLDEMIHRTQAEYQRQHEVKR